jgi:outer membrane protein
MTRTSTPILIRLALATLCMVPAVAGAQPVLTADHAVQLALERNSQVINAAADVLSAKSGVYGAYSRVLPSVAFDLTRGGSQTRNASGYQIFGGATPVSSGTPEQTSYSTSKVFSGQWTVLSLASLASLSSARAGLKGAEHARQATRNLVALQARQQYYEVVKAVKQVEVNANALRLARDNSRRVRTLFEVGSVSRSDVLKQDVLTSQAEVDSIVAVQALLAQRNSLASFVGLQEATMGEVDTVLTVVPQDYDEATVLREAEANRPDLKAADADLKAARSAVMSSRYAYLPYVSVSGSASYSPFSDQTTLVPDESDPSRYVPRSAHNESDRQVGGRVALSWDIVDGLSRNATAAQARAGFERARNANEVLRRDLAGQVHAVILTYRQVLSAEVAARAALESATESLRLTQQKYNVGSATILDLVDAQVQLQRAQSQVIAAQAAVRVVQAQIDQVRGLAL